MRLMLIVLSLFVITGCTNRIRSDLPWFTSADEAGAPGLKPGVWVIAVEPHCYFRESAPLERWPACAKGVVIRPHELLWLDLPPWDQTKDSHLTYNWRRDLFVLAAGDPRILQGGNCWRGFTRKMAADAAASDAASAAAASDTALASAAEDGHPADPARTTPKSDDTAADVGSAPAADAPEPGSLRQCYNAVRPTQIDASGQIVVAEFWPIVCGPWPRRDKQGFSANVTAAPFAGLTIVDDDCTARDIDALRAAARSSEHVLVGMATVPDQPFSVPKARWVRDGYH